ncbi:hypothetical protein [Myceligenerans indicum]|uniref:Uncharacterized protein n=1 Tax=Myceligenerans indicum TaxID=2593663 RepID=A0ABS1LJF1_9MICO|nr:hypothetical protein [Myceligenerans indicum]MBL0886365.1 hypothetical protein [Myceligenerans indicum]
MDLLTELLDRSIEEVVEAASPESFDRPLIRHNADMWHNGLHELLHAVSAPAPGEQESRAREALVWMMTVRPGRVELFTRHGIPDTVMQALTPQPWPDTGRDYRGLVRPLPAAMSPSVVDEVLGDYDLHEASIERVEVERTRGALTAHVTASVARRFALLDPRARDASLSVELDDVTDLVFDQDDRHGLTLIAADGEVTVGIGKKGHGYARRATLRLEDHHWHLSAAGLAADVVRPHTVLLTQDTGPVTELTPDASRVAWVLRLTMREIRIARSPLRAASPGIRALANAVRGAGSDLRAIADLPPARRDAAFADLLQRWKRDRPALAGRITDNLEHLTPAPHLAPGEDRIDPARSRAILSAAEPRHLSWTVDATAPSEPRGPTLTVIEAGRDAADGSWRLMSHATTHPHRARITTTGYTVAGGRAITST